MPFIFPTPGDTPDLDGGGYQYGTEVAELPAVCGHEVQAIYPNPGNTLPSDDRRNRFRLHRLLGNGISFLSRWREASTAAKAVVSSLLIELSETLLCFHHAYLSSVLAGLRHAGFFNGPWALGNRLSNHVCRAGLGHRPLDPVSGQVMHRVERLSTSRAAKVLVASEYSQSCPQIWHSGLRCDTEVVGGGADLNRSRPPADRELVRRQRGLDQCHFLFLAVQKLDPRMRLRQLLEAFHAVVRGFPDARLAIAGRGSQRETLQDRIRSLGPEGSVQLLGFFPEPELPGLYQPADCALMPSLDLEGFGLATPEYPACGTPVLASSSGANPELIRPLGNDLLFEPGNPRSISECMTGGLSGRIQPTDWDRCAAPAKQAIRWDRPANAIEKAAQSLAGAVGCNGAMRLSFLKNLQWHLSCSAALP